MTKKQIKQWLEWFVNNYNTTNELYYVDLQDEIMHYEKGSIAKKMFGNWVVSDSLQLILQEEIENMGLKFSIDTYDGCVVEIGRNEHERLASCESDSVLKAMMITFREAWKATH